MDLSSVPPIRSTPEVGAPPPSEAEKEMITYLTRMRMLFLECLPNQADPNANPVDEGFAASEFCNYMAAINRLIQSSPPGTFSAAVQTDVKTLQGLFYNLIPSGSQLPPTVDSDRAIHDAIVAALTDLGFRGGGLYRVPGPTAQDQVVGSTLVAQWLISYECYWNPSPSANYPQDIIDAVENVQTALGNVGDSQNELMIYKDFQRWNANKNQDYLSMMFVDMRLVLNHYGFNPPS